MHITIAGGGVIGLSCAWRLATAGAKVTLYDPREPGHGATLASLGALWPTSALSRGPLQQIDRASLWQWESFATQLANESKLPVSYRRNGRIEILNSAKATARAREEAQVACREWPAFGNGHATMEVLDHAAAQRINPGLAPFPHGALLCRATAQVNVRELVAALVAACRARDVEFRREPITGTSHPGDVLLITAGAWTTQLAPRVPVSPAKGQGIALEMPASRPLTTILKSQSIYLIPWDNEILVGSTTEPEAGFDETPTDDARNMLQRSACNLIPELANTKLIRHWAGLRPESDDGLPAMGPLPGAPGIFVCAGHYKTGIALAPLVSDWMSKLILHNNPPPELAPFLPTRFTDTPSPANPSPHLPFG